MNKHCKAYEAIIADKVRCEPIKTRNGNILEVTQISVIQRDASESVYVSLGTDDGTIIEDFEVVAHDGNFELWLRVYISLFWEEPTVLNRDEYNQLREIIDPTKQESIERKRRLGKTKHIASKTPVLSAHEEPKVVYVDGDGNDIEDWDW